MDEYCSGVFSSNNSSIELLPGLQSRQYQSPAGAVAMGGSVQRRWNGLLQELQKAMFASPP